MPENLVSRDGFNRPVPRQPAHLHTQAESGAYLRDSSRVPRRRPFMKPPYAIGSVPSLSSHAIAYRWRSLPRVRRHRASKPQGQGKPLSATKQTSGVYSLDRNTSPRKSFPKATRLRDETRSEARGQKCLGVSRSLNSFHGGGGG